MGIQQNLFGKKKTFYSNMGNYKILVNCLTYEQCQSGWWRRNSWPCGLNPPLIPQGILQSVLWMFLNYFLLNSRRFFLIVCSPVRVLLSDEMILNCVFSEHCEILRQKHLQRISREWMAERRGKRIDFVQFIVAVLVWNTTVCSHNCCQWWDIHRKRRATVL